MNYILIWHKGPTGSAPAYDAAQKRIPGIFGQWQSQDRPTALHFRPRVGD
jgi:hypothetical protein